MNKFLIKLDLNLLKSLYILLQERNVTHAAEKMFITQSAMSKTLRRLREALDDPILVRTTTGLIPTPLAKQLETHLEAMFEQLEKSLEPEKYDPALETGGLRIAAPESFSLGLVIKLIKRLKVKSPNLAIELLHLDDNYLDLLACGEIDFVVYIEQRYPEEFTTQKLFSFSPLILSHKTHPLAEKKLLTLEDIFSYPKVAFQSPHLSSPNLVDILKEVEAVGLDYELYLTTSHMLIAFSFLKDSQALMLVPDYPLSFPMFDLVTYPVDHIPMFNCLHSDVALIQHEQTLRSPMHRWVAEEAGILCDEEFNSLNNA